ncbi:uncharacterized protein LOC130736581 [Lotus japonicus]|uniref:uncharacterized protein LOC130736581 n=1 Tax=Lotus japonicus TaxID=34305 RepID=UPI002587706F|nr:uncharacterized protein LOC130736581 [Lotus japonicus]
MTNLVLETYDEKTDPKDHLLRFNAKMVMSAVSDPVKCRMLPSTFRGAAMDWFMALPEGSLARFRDLSSKFLGHFSARAIEDLFDIWQGERETLKQYMKRYSAMSARFEELEPRVCVCAFKGALSRGKFSCKLSRELACSMTEVRARAQDYILEEEIEAHKRKHERAVKVSLARKQIQDEEASQEQRVKEAGQFVKKNKRGLSSSGRKNVGYRRSRRTAETSRRMRPKGRSSKELTKLLLEVGIEDMDREGECRMDPGYVAKDQPKWCEYHNLEGHSTTDCFTLKGQIKQLIKARQPRAARRKKAEETDNGEGKGTVETANTIAGGFEGGDGVSTAARKQVGGNSIGARVSSPIWVPTPRHSSIVRGF